MQQVDRAPLLIAGHPHHPEAHVVVHPDHVRVLVVAEVVRLLPLRRGPDLIPLPVAGMDFGIVHPIPLTVGHVVPDLHVLYALGDAEGHRTRDRTRLRPAGLDHDPRRGIEDALEGDRMADVARVRLAERLDDVAANRVEVGTELLDILAIEVCVLLDVGDRHEDTPISCRRSRIGKRHRDLRSSTATDSANSSGHEGRREPVISQRRIASNVNTVDLHLSPTPKVYSCGSNGGHQ